MQGLRKKLRGTVVHKAYAFLRYEIGTVLKFRFYYNIRKGNLRKIGHFIMQRTKGSFCELPKHVTIDIVSCCNLRCPLCSVPPYLTKGKDKFLSFEAYKAIVEKIDIASDVILVYAGEPFLHPEFFKMVRYATERHFTTTITNGTLLDEERVGELLESGLDFIQISFDGFSQESFEKYRVGARFYDVKRNIERLIETRRRKNAGLPHITITYLVNAHNEDEIGNCREHFLRTGADRFLSKAINLNVHRRLDGKGEEDLSHWIPRKSTVTLYDREDGGIGFKEREGSCNICMSPVIRCDGEVLLCCHDIFNTVKIGNIFDRDLKDMWLSEPYRKMRALGRQRRLEVCRKCGK